MDKIQIITQNLSKQTITTNRNLENDNETAVKEGKLHNIDI